MSRFSRYGRKMCLAYATAAFITYIALSAVFSGFKYIEDNSVGYYVVEYNGKEIGRVSTPEEAETAFLDARLQLQKESESAVYIEGDYTLTEKDKLVGETDDITYLSNNFYSEMKEMILDVKKEVYVVDIDGFKVVLSSLDEVEELLNASKAGYDKNSLFHVELSSNNDRLSLYEYELVRIDTDTPDVPTVSVGGEGNDSSSEKEDADINKVVGMYFSESVKIMSAYADASEVMNLEDAISEVTKEKEENEVYEVVAGDSLYKIGKKFDLSIGQILAMNTHISESDYLHIGDQIIVTVPKPELSVVVEEQQAYREEYNLPVQYVYNDKQYTTYSKTKKEAVAGVRDVVAIVTYCNGVETGRVIIEETIIEEATAKVVEKGTKEPPTYIKPITGGRITSYFGWRTVNGVKGYHRGVDWAVPTGTTVRASCSGTVTQAGWGGSYGYYVVIKHVDGSTTTYAHLSKVLVSKGQKVSQGAKIGLSGNTGNSTGPHLHFELKINGNLVNPLKHIK